MHSQTTCRSILVKTETNVLNGITFKIFTTINIHWELVIADPCIQKKSLNAYMFNYCNYLQFSDRHVLVDSADPDHTAPRVTV